MNSHHLTPLQRLFLWTLRHWGSAQVLPPYVLRTLRASREGPTLLGVADRLLSWYHLRRRGDGQLNAPAARALTTLETQLLAAPFCARYHDRATLRLWLADHVHRAGLTDAPTVLAPLADALESLGPDALLSPAQVQAADYGVCAASGGRRSSANFR